MDSRLDLTLLSCRDVAGFEILNVAAYSTTSGIDRRVASSAACDSRAEVYARRPVNVPVGRSATVQTFKASRAGRPSREAER